MFKKIKCRARRVQNLMEFVMEMRKSITLQTLLVFLAAVKSSLLLKMYCMRKMHMKLQTLHFPQ